MSKLECTNDREKSEADDAYTDSALISRGTTADGAVFEEIELKMMRHVLDAVSSELKIIPGSEAHRTAALAIVRHAASGTADQSRLIETVAAELRAAKAPAND